MMELQKRIDILDLWDEMPYSLDIKDFGNTVILLSESCEIRFINCIEVNIKSDILFKNKSMKFHEYRNHEYDIQDISVEPCVVKTDGTMTHNKKRVSPVLNGVKAKIAPNNKITILTHFFFKIFMKILLKNFIYSMHL